MFDSLLKAAVGIVTLPVDVVADVVTLGGSLNAKDQPYTVKKARDIMDNIEDATKSDKR